MAPESDSGVRIAEITPRLRSWLFLEGANADALHEAARSDADVLIQELEDFTAPDRRPAARELAAPVLERWRAARKVTAIRINPLDVDGLTDLRAVMPARPDVVMLPKANDPEQIRALDAHIREAEQTLGIAIGSTAIVPNIEQAQGLVNTHRIATASARVVACLVASEDMAADLGAERGPDARELDYVRARFHVECVAAGVLSIDCPYTYSDLDGVERETRDARRLGYVAKAAVAATHVAVINDVMTPTASACANARALVLAFEAARARGDARVELDGALVEWPGYLNAKRLLARAAHFGIEPL